MRTKPKLNSACVAAIEQIERRLLMSTYTVNTLSDAVTPVTGLLTLRQAVADANANAGADTIDFSSSVFPTTGVNTISLGQGEINFTDGSGSTTVKGPGAAALIISGAQLDRVLSISSGATVALNGLTISNGAVVPSSNAAATGGGIKNAGTLSLTDVTVSNNSVLGMSINDDDTDGGAAFGGGIYSTGALTITDCTVTMNSATGGDAFTGTAGDADGGGIYATEVLNITGSLITSNNISGGTANQFGDQNAGNASGGGIYSGGQLTLNTSTVSDNSTNGGTGYGAGQSDGGGIYVSSKSSLTDDTFSDNLASGGGDNSTEGGNGGDAWGGAVFSVAALSIASSSFTGNNATGGGGTLVDYGGAGNASGGAIAALTSLSISNSTVSTNAAEGGATDDGGSIDGLAAAATGGGIYAGQSLNVSNCSISSNTAQGADGGSYADDNPEVGGIAQGGGIATLGTGTISFSSLTANAAIGGIGDTADLTIEPSGDADGGGLFNGGHLTVINSTLSQNRASGGAGYIATEEDNAQYNGNGGNGFGGGIFSSSVLTVENSTLAGNSGVGGAGPDGNDTAQNAGNGGNGEGGAIYSGTSVTLENTTIVQNTVSAGSAGAGSSFNGYTGSNGTAGVAQGGGIFAGSNSLLNNSIVSANNGDSGADVYSTLSTTSSHNLIGYGGGLGNGTIDNQIGIHDPMLGALADNGGPTLTMLPLAGSPVINAGSNSLIPSGISTDQRGTGFVRIVANTVDIGSVEYDVVPVIMLTPGANQTAIIGQDSAISPGSFAQSNATAPFTITVKWGDGSANTVFDMPAAGTIPVQTHAYSKMGGDTVSISIEDSAGNTSALKTFTVEVTAAPAKTSATTLLASTNLTTPGTNITFTATVTDSAGSPLTGTVNFTLNGVIINSVSLNNGTAIFTTASLPGGTNQIGAAYSGGSQYATSSASPVMVTVQNPSQFSAGFVQPAFASTAVAGEKFKTHLPLAITNNGSATKGVFTIDLYADTAATLDGNQKLLATEKKTTTVGAGRHLTIDALLKSLPPTLPGGNYYLIAEVIDTKNLISLAATQTTVNVEVPVIKLAATVSPTSPGTFAAVKKTGSITVTLTNNGNITANGILSIVITPYAEGNALSQVVASSQIKTSLAPGRHRTFRLHLKLPSSIPVGSYFPDASIMFSGNALTVIGTTPFTIA